MNNRQRILYYPTIGLVFGCLLFVLFGCNAGLKGGATLPGSQQNGTGLSSNKTGQLTLFLNLTETKGPSPELIIRSIEILAENNTWVPLVSGPIEANSQSIPGGQMFLGRSFVTTGYYSRLRIETTWNSTSKTTLSDPTVTELEIRNPLYVAQGDSHSLFLTWDVVASIAAGSTAKPSLSVVPKLKKLLVDVAYVACPEINTVYMICTNKNVVCDSVGVQDGPSYLSSDRIAPTVNLFALTEKEMGIKLIGPSSNRVEANYPLSMLGRDLHFVVSPNSLWAYVIDRKRGNILRINLRSGAIDLRNRLGYGPSYILYLEKQGLLAVTLSLSQTVVLLDPETLTQVQAISTGSNPGGLMVHNDNYLYITEAGGNSVMIYDLALNKVQRRIPVDLSPRRLVAANSNIYVANYNSNSLSLLKARQLGVSKTITLDGPPLELAYSAKNKWLYVGNELAQGVDIIDPINNRVAGRIALGAIPKGMAVLE